jgi:hypothetical protein
MIFTTSGGGVGDGGGNLPSSHISLACDGLRQAVPGSHVARDMHRDERSKEKCTEV